MVRVFAISDIHVDYQENREWLSGLSSVDYLEDILILAGDLTDDLQLLEQCFHELSTKFLKALFVPGNHELWVARGKTSALTSIEKYQLVCKVAEANGISMEPFELDSLSIVPLLGWYDFSFGTPCEKLLGGWMDFHACVWPDHLQAPDITRYFLEKNRAYLQTTNRTLISFSHFLPRIDLMPFYIPQSYRYLYPALGSVLLEEQVRILKPGIHVYGHSHVNRYVDVDGIQYINNAFGCPFENKIAVKELLCIYQN